MRYVSERKVFPDMRLVQRGKDRRFPKLNEHFSYYDILCDGSTEKMMQSFTQNRWVFPMTLYFESTSIDKEVIFSSPLPIKEMRSIKKSMYITSTGWQREYIPAYVLQIENESMLKKAFTELFYLAEQNFLFALTNEPSLFYQGYSVTTTSDTIEILTADYDGQGAVFITMKEG